MSRVMYLTVGASLFHSASWDPARPGFPDGLPDYRKAVTTNSDFLRSPEARMRFPSVIRELEDALSDGDAERWAAWLPEPLHRGRHDAGTANRYAAELATVLRLAEEEGGDGGARELLHGYERILVVADPTHYSDEDRRRPYLAAQHLEAYLRLLRGDGAGSDGVELLEIPGLASGEPKDLLGGVSSGRFGLLGLCREIQRRQEELGSLCVDLVVTGGFKVYGYVLSRLVDAFEVARARVIYVHEQGQSLVTLTREGLSIDGQKQDWSRFSEGPAPGS